MHLPACTGKKLENEFVQLIRGHPQAGIFQDRVDISGTAHSVKIVKEMNVLRKKNAQGSYLVYAMLYFFTRLSLPPSPRILRRRSLMCEDRMKLRYHAKEIASCAGGVFVPTEQGMWPYDMWRNARRMLRKKKPVWVIIGKKDVGWKVLPLEFPPKRELRLDREKTIARVGEYSEPREYPSLFTLIRDAFKQAND